MSPAARLVQQLEDLRKRMASDPETPDFDVVRRDMVRQIEREQRQPMVRGQGRLERVGHLILSSQVRWLPGARLSSVFRPTIQAPSGYYILMHKIEQILCQIFNSSESCILTEL
jgi:hypothetical protein